MDTYLVYSFDNIWYLTNRFETEFVQTFHPPIIVNVSLYSDERIVKNWWIISCEIQFLWLVTITRIVCLFTVIRYNMIDTSCIRRLTEHIELSGLGVFWGQFIMIRVGHKIYSSVSEFVIYHREGNFGWHEGLE